MTYSANIHHLIILERRKERINDIDIDMTKLYGYDRMTMV